MKGSTTITRSIAREQTTVHDKLACTHIVLMQYHRDNGGHEVLRSGR
jgi:hypothetical protein